MIAIVPFEPKFLPEAAGLFIRNFQALRRAVPVLPDDFEDPQRVSARLEGLFARCPGAAALQDGRLAGYMGWYLPDDFRQTGRKAAYCPEWGHAAVSENQAAIYRALYRAASAAGPALTVNAGGEQPTDLQHKFHRRGLTDPAFRTTPVAPRYSTR